MTKDSSSREMRLASLSTAGSEVSGPAFQNPHGPPNSSRGSESQALCQEQTSPSPDFQRPDFRGSAQEQKPSSDQLAPLDEPRGCVGGADAGSPPESSSKARAVDKLVISDISTSTFLADANIDCSSTGVTEIIEKPSPFAVANLNFCLIGEEYKPATIEHGQSRLPFRFLDLPLELRVKVYRLIIPPDFYICTSFSVSPGAKKLHDNDIWALAFASRQVRSEILPLVYGDSIIIFLNSNFLRNTYSRWITDLDPGLAAHIKCVSIHCFTICWEAAPQLGRISELEPKAEGMNRFVMPSFASLEPGISRKELRTGRWVLQWREDEGWIDGPGHKVDELRRILARVDERIDAMGEAAIIGFGKEGLEDLIKALWDSLKYR
ncbi:MAG: hypothetical protein Q9220_006305 [cf. Caloplaca sp. 1 TL-2023]